MFVDIHRFASSIVSWQLARSPQQLYLPLHVAAVHFYLNIVWLERAHFLAAAAGPGASEDTECGSGGDMLPWRGDHWHWHQPHTCQQRRNNTPAPPAQSRLSGKKISFQ